MFFSVPGSSNMPDTSPDGEAGAEKHSDTQPGEQQYSKEFRQNDEAFMPKPDGFTSAGNPEEASGHYNEWHLPEYWGGLFTTGISTASARLWIKR